MRSPDPAGLNARLVTAGIRVTELSAQRRTLEQVVLELTGTGSDRIDAGRPRVIGVELQLLLRRRRVWLCWRCCAGCRRWSRVLLAVTDIVPPPGRGGNFLSAVVSNGQLFPAAALALVLPVFLPITVAVVAGDTVAGEAAAGTLRYLLVRPVGRLRLLAGQARLGDRVRAARGAAGRGDRRTWSASGCSASARTHARRRRRGDLAVRGGADPGRAGRAHSWPTVGYVALCMLTLGAVGLFFSTLTDSSLAAALGVLAVVVTSAVLLPLDAAAGLRPYLPTTHWLAWVDLYRVPILWADVREGVTVQAG